MFVSVQRQCWPQKWWQRVQKTILSVVGVRIAAINLFQLDLVNHEIPYGTVKLAPPPLQKSHTAAWLEAFPFASIGNLLSHDELRIAIALWTGAKMSVVILLMI